MKLPRTIHGSERPAIGFRLASLLPYFRPLGPCAKAGIDGIATTLENDDDGIDLD